MKSCYLVNFRILLILFCSPMQTFFIRNKQVIDRWFDFCRDMGMKRESCYNQILYFLLVSTKYTVPCVSAGRLDYWLFNLISKHQQQITRKYVLMILMICFLLTYTFQRSVLPHPRAAAQRHVTAPPAVVSIHTAMDHYTSVVPNHL